MLKTTKDYNLFNFLESNRDIDETHVTRLMNSMKKKNLLSPIIVNEKYEVIDGQHRLKALEKLNLEVNYLVVDGYGEEEIQIYNALQRNWNFGNFHEFFVKKGYDEYVKLDNFMAMHKYPLSIALVFANGISHPGFNLSMAFKSGNYKFITKNYGQVAGYYDLIKDYFPKMSDKRAFAMAFYKIVTNESCDWNRFYASVKRHHNKVLHEHSCEDYMKSFQKIYNSGRKEKVRFYEGDL